jgi:hypothetical protein
MPAVPTIAADAPLAVAVTQAIRTGNLDGLRRERAAQVARKEP